MSAYPHHPHSHPQPPSHQPFIQHHPQQQQQQQKQHQQRPDLSPLDLLSRVALEQFTSPPPHLPHPSQPSSPPTSQSIWPSQPPSQTTPQPTQPYISTPQPLHPFEPLPKVRFPVQLTPPAFPAPYNNPRPVYSSDFSPVSSDDGSSSRHARPPPDLPPRLNKIMRVSKEHTSAKTRTQPSRFCHICSRTSKKVGLVACGNFATGACRKVVCQKCFNDHKWDWETALNMGSKWICTHCRQACPDRAQCAIYKRTNERRREQQQQQRSTRTESVGAIRGGHGRFINKQLD